MKFNAKVYNEIFHPVQEESTGSVDAHIRKPDPNKKLEEKAAEETAEEAAEETAEETEEAEETAEESKK